MRSDELQQPTRKFLLNLPNLPRMLGKTKMTGATMTLVIFLVLICFTRIGSGQVTFSRDWNPGKRSPVPEEGNCLANAKSTAAACHVLMNELKHLSACEARAVVQFLRAQDNDITSGSDQAIFSGGR